MLELSTIILMTLAIITMSMPLLVLVVKAGLRISLFHILAHRVR